jgi:molybdopterin/thiamine biosynthesis adenylyltransferase
MTRPSPPALPETHVGTVVLPSSLLDGHSRPLRGRVLEAPDGFLTVVLDPDGPRELGVTAAAPSPSVGPLRLSMDPEVTASWEGRPLSVVLTDTDRYFDRVRALPGIDAVRHKRVAIAGLGSVGSDIAIRLARLGVEVLAFDPDHITLENLVRWGAPVEPGRSLGRAKAQVFEAVVQTSVPGGRARAFRLDVVRDARQVWQHLQAFKPDLLVAATDTEDSRRQVNAACADLDIPGLFVGLADGANSLRVQLVERARRGPCYLCAATGEGVPLGVRRTLTPYASEVAEPGHAVPALPVDVALGAGVACRLALELLAGRPWRALLRNGDQQGSVMFMALRPDWWVFESAWDRLVYEPTVNPDCPCAHEPEAPNA